MNQRSNQILENANKLRQIEYWVDSAVHDLDVAETLFKSGKYDWCLFIAHLVLEKMLKALYVKMLVSYHHVFMILSGWLIWRRLNLMSPPWNLWMQLIHSIFQQDIPMKN